jgi:hypothetical protein
MIDALFWYTGLVAWILIVFGVVSTLVIDAHDRSVMRHGEQRSTDKPELLLPRPLRAQCREISKTTVPARRPFLRLH